MIERIIAEAEMEDDAAARADVLDWLDGRRDVLLSIARHFDEGRERAGQDMAESLTCEIERTVTDRLPPDEIDALIDLMIETVF